MAEEKAGRRHSENDIRIGRKAKGNARDIIAALDDLGFIDEPAAVAPLIPAADAPQKAGDIPPAAEPVYIWGYVKAAGDDWTLDVLANPYGGPDNGKDADGQFFSPRTKFHEDKIPLPPVVYYHGYGDNKRPMGLPEFIGHAVKRGVGRGGATHGLPQKGAGRHVPDLGGVDGEPGLAGGRAERA